MSIVITVLTVGISIARSSITEKYKSIMKYLNPISGIFLSISGFSYLLMVGGKFKSPEETMGLIPLLTFH